MTIQIFPMIKFLICESLKVRHSQIHSQHHFLNQSLDSIILFILYFTNLLIIYFIKIYQSYSIFVNIRYFIKINIHLLLLLIIFIFFFSFIIIIFLRICGFCCLIIIRIFYCFKSFFKLLLILI